MTSTGNRGGGRRSLGSDTQDGWTPMRRFRIPEAMWVELNEAAQAEGLTASEFVRDAIAERIDASRRHSLS